MFWRGWKQRRGGDVGHGPGHWTVVADLGREVAAKVCPAEEHLFDGVLAEFRADPRRTLAGDGARPPVGIGVDLTLFTPQVLWLVSLLASAAAGKVADRGLDALGKATRERLALLLQRRRGDSVADTTASSEEAAPEEEESGPGPREGFTVAELQEIRLLLEAGACGRIPPERTERIIAAVMAALGLPSDGNA